uniref:Uncharacterized protein n=1 Tax=Ditylenchus dipsaci TaxID=166011 RepID=A0A915DGA7_9BILA
MEFTFPNKAAARIVFDTTQKWFDNKGNFDAIDKVVSLSSLVISNFRLIGKVFPISDFLCLLKKGGRHLKRYAFSIERRSQDGSGSETKEFSESGASGSSDPEASKSSEPFSKNIIHPSLILLKSTIIVRRKTVVYPI